MEKNLAILRKNEEKQVKQNNNTTSAKVKQDEAKEAQRQLEIEFRHQKEESERRELGRAMLSDAANNRPNFNRSCLNLLNSYQGT